MINLSDTAELKEIEAIDGDIFLKVDRGGCLSCESAQPFFEDLEKKYGDKLKFVTIPLIGGNEPKSMEFESKYGKIDSFPHFVLIRKDGKSRMFKDELRDFYKRIEEGLVRNMMNEYDVLLSKELGVE